MQVQIEELNSVCKKISIEVPVEQVNAEIEKVYASIQKKAKLQGFRQGKAPMQFVKRTYRDAMSDEVMRHLYDQTLFKTLDEHKIEPVDAPVIESDVLEEGKPFKYRAIVEIMPNVVLNEYTGLVVEKEKYTPNPDSIDGELKRMQEKLAQLVPVEDGAMVENGHTITIDYSLTVEGLPEETARENDAVLEIGAKQLLPGMEEQLLGMKIGEEREIKVPLPEGHRNPEAVGKEAIFQLKLKEIKRKELPELDNDFAKQFGDYESMSQLRAKMTEYHEQHENDRIHNKLKGDLIQALTAKNPLEVPASLVKRQLDHMLENFKTRAQSTGMSMQMMGLDDAGFHERFKETAADKVKGSLLLMALIEKENISVNDEDIIRKYEELAAGNTDMLVRIKEHYESNQDAKSNLFYEVKEDKAIDFLLKKAVVNLVEPTLPKEA